MKINILLADGRKLLREALGLLLEQHDDLRVAGEAEEGQDVLRLVKALSVQVVILNPTPTSHGIPDLVRAIIKTRPGVRVIVLTFNPAVEFVQDILDAGALGCLTRECAGAELVAAVRTVLENKLYLSPSLVDRVVKRYVSPSSHPAAEKSLAPREREILRHIASGHTTKEIAAALGVGTKTVETHRRRMMEKLNRHSVAELTKYAVLEGLTPLESGA
jgi:two-component system, NarL family, response regulator NreC